MLRMIGLVLLSVSVTCFGQISTEEAQARLAARQRATTEPVQELADLRQIVAELRKENAELKGEVAALKAELKARPPATVSKSNAADLASMRFIGRSIDEANSLVMVSTEAHAKGAQPYKFYLIATRDDTQVWQAKIFFPSNQPPAPFGIRNPVPVIHVTLEVRDGKIEHSSIDHAME